MPEGDTIHRTAQRLRPALAGHELLRFEAPRLVGDRPKPGSAIDDVRAVGKHLLVDFDGGLTLETHMRMTGSWHLYRSAERWQRPAYLMRARIDVEGWTAVCFAAPVVRTYRRSAPGGPLGTDLDPVGHLGPDLCRADLSDADIDVCVGRFATHVDPATQISEALLDQRVACGVGNVYKNEALFACGVDPFAPVATIDQDTRRRLIVTASRMLRANLGGGPRRTVPGGLAVYGRQHQPCRQCATAVRMRRDGRLGRSTYWCPSCQPSTTAG
jgi:endonuclease-8